VPRYLWQVTYTPSGASGVIADGGTVRCDAIQRMVERVGGSVESCYFALGGRDLYVIGQVPDEVAAASLSIHTTAGGAARTEAIPLLTPDQMDKATSTFAFAAVQETT
jgi:uncharacterized protein with GYD domain